MAFLLGGLLSALGQWPASADPAPAGTFQALQPARILDTRLAIGAPGQAVAAFHSISVQVDGRGQVPSTDVAAVVVNVTVVSPTSTGYLTVYPAGQPRPNASNLNFRTGQTVPNLVTVAVGASGQVVLYNGSGGSVNLVADVSGYYVGGTPTDPGTFHSLSPARILDTRGGLGAPAKAVGPHQTLSLQVTGHGGVVAGASAVALNVTVTSPTTTGYLTVYPTGGARPNASDVNFGAGQTVPNSLITKLPADGQLSLYNGSGGTVQLVVDVSGFFLAGTPDQDGEFTPLPPARILDTRSGLGAPPGALTFGPTAVQVTGRGGVPASNVAAVILNLTVTQPGAAGYAGVYPGETRDPRTSNLNFSAHQTIANLVVVPVGADGAIVITQSTQYPAEFVADVAGFVQGPSAVATFGAISGVVTSPAHPGQGVPNAHVEISPKDPVATGSANLFTDSSGHYLADQLPASSTGYIVCINSDEANQLNPGTGYLNECYDGVGWDGTFPPADATAMPVSVGMTSTVNPSVPVGGAISGKVTLANGQPAPGSHVEIYGTQGYEGGLAPAADGSYLVRGLPTGTYAICFDGGSSLESRTFVPYVFECYKNVLWNGSTNPTTLPGTKVSVAAGHLTSGVNQAVHLPS